MEMVNVSLSVWFGCSVFPLFVIAASLECINERYISIRIINRKNNDP